MKYIVEPVIKFNGRIYYGEDKLGNRHDQSLLISKKSGQVAVILNNDGSIIEAKVFPIKLKAQMYAWSVVPSEGIMA